MNVLDATRAWLREECPLIDRHNKFNANYIGGEATEYTLRSAGESHSQTILGADVATHYLTFEALMLYGTATAPNLAAADFFSELSAWVRGADRARVYPEVSGYEVERITASNAGLIVMANADTARYQLQIQIKMKERI